MIRFASYTVFLLLLVYQNGISQKMNQTKIDAKGNEMLLGKINKDGFTNGDYKAWFDNQYKNYAVDLKSIKSIKSELNNYKITIFLGTWCGDSRREVPRFYKILEAADYPMDQLTVVALDYEKNQYKKSPGGEEKGLNIVKVPTFIFYKKGKAVNRIIESPVKSLEQDMASILQGNDYIPHHNNVPMLPVD